MKLLNELDKKPFQAYTLEHGIERIKVKVPLASSRAFEAAFEKAISAGASKQELLELLTEHGGAIRTVKSK